MAEFKALLFDVFGTLVDWREGIARETAAVLLPLGHSIDVCAFAGAWRAAYQPAMEEIRSGRRPFAKLDLLHRSNLDAILPDFGLQGLDDAQRCELTLAWHRLDSWPDVASGLERLKSRFLLVAVSNANISMMVDLARRNRFPWDAILGAEFVRDYKPKPRVYEAAAEALALAPHECLMVAAHSNDLAGAARCGLATAHIARPREMGRSGGEAAPGVAVDFAVADLNELAEALAC